MLVSRPTMQVMSHTKRLASYAVSLRTTPLPETARDAARRVLLDAVGVTLAGSRTAAGRLITQYVAGQQGPATSRVLGSTVATSPQLAALANGVMAAEVE